jgi:biopolymer transport protein ExbD
MAEINMSAPIGRRNRTPIKVDLTAMVDLGFLLITFFMLASTMYKPKVLEVLKPNDKDIIEPPKIKASKSLVLIIGDNDMLYRYDPSTYQTTLEIDSFKIKPRHIRKMILDKQKEIINQHGIKDKDDLTIILKPLSKSNLQNIVDIMDEMIICHAPRYAIVKPNEEIDQKVIQAIGYYK